MRAVSIVLVLLGLACRHAAPPGRPRADAAGDSVDALEAAAAETAGEAAPASDATGEGPERDALSAEPARDAEPETGDASAEAGADRAPYPLNAACAEPGLSVTRTVLSESFEAWPLGALPGDPWVEANAGREALVVGSWVHAGNRALAVQSYQPPGEAEILYARLAVARTPARLVFTMYLAPNGFVSKRQFASVGVGYVSSKFALDRHVSLATNDHTMTFQGSVGGSSEAVFNEIPFASSAFRDSPPAVYSYVRADLDFCTGLARIYVGSDDQAPLRATLSFDAAVPINSYWIVGGADESVIDDVSVEASGVLD